MTRHASVVKNLAQQLGYADYVLSPPELVEGGLNPPPNSKFPGRLCYVVDLRVGPEEYKGYGSTVAAALSAAEFLALTGLQRILRDKRERQYASSSALSDSNSQILPAAETDREPRRDHVSERSPPLHPLLCANLPPHPLLKCREIDDDSNRLPPHPLVKANGGYNPDGSGRGNGEKEKRVKKSLVPIDVLPEPFVENGVIDLSSNLGEEEEEEDVEEELIDFGGGKYDKEEQRKAQKLAIPLEGPQFFI